MSKELKSVEYGLEKIFEGAQDFLPLLGTDYVEFYVGNAKKINCLGFGRVGGGRGRSPIQITRC